MLSLLFEYIFGYNYKFLLCILVCVPLVVVCISTVVVIFRCEAAEVGDGQRPLDVWQRLEDEKTCQTASERSQIWK